VGGEYRREGEEDIVRVRLKTMRERERERGGICRREREIGEGEKESR
jgi:hypothetical protein